MKLGHLGVWYSTDKLDGAQLRDFVRAVETDGKPRCDGREGRRSVELVRAIYESSRTGRPVLLS